MKIYCSKHAKIVAKKLRRKKKKANADQSTPSKNAHNIDDEEEVIFDSDSDEEGDEGKSPKVPFTERPVQKQRVVQRVVNKNSKYFKNKERRSEGEKHINKDLVKIMASVISISEYKEKKEIRKKYWSNFGGFSKGEFRKVWDQCEKTISDEEQKFFERCNNYLMRQRKKTSPTNVSRKRPSINNANAAESNLNSN